MGRFIIEISFYRNVPINFLRERIIMNCLNLHKFVIILMLPVFHMAGMDEQAKTGHELANPAAMKQNIISMVRASINQILSIDPAKLEDVSPDFFHQYVQFVTQDMDLREKALNSLNHDRLKRMYDLICQRTQNPSPFMKELVAKQLAVGMQMSIQYLQGSYDKQKAKKTESEVFTTEALQEISRLGQECGQKLIALLEEQGLNEQAEQLTKIQQSYKNFETLHLEQIKALYIELSLQPIALLQATSSYKDFIQNVQPIIDAGPNVCQEIGVSRQQIENLELEILADALQKLQLHSDSETKEANKQDDTPK